MELLEAHPERETEALGPTGSFLLSPCSDKGKSNHLKHFRTLFLTGLPSEELFYQGIACLREAVPNHGSPELEAGKEEGGEDGASSWGTG